MRYLLAFALLLAGCAAQSPVSNPVWFSATPQSGPAPLTVTLADDASFPGWIRYDWDFGDGATGGPTGTVTHAYARPGTYTVRVTRTDTLAEGADRGSATIRVTKGR